MFKRIFDLFIAIIALLLLAPLFFLIAFLVWRQGGRPVFFLQPRAGLNGSIFHIIKFRTMRDAVDENGELLPDEQRLFPLGNFLRKTSLDELPELFNVLKGDMSLAGPRPLLAEYLKLYTPEQNRRHEVRPGITGWAQVNGRNNLTWEEKFELDIWYVDHRSLLLDIRILFLTLRKVFVSEGINQPGQVTVEKFKGSHL